MEMNILDLYTDYLICQNKYATATGLADMLPGQISHDKVTRFLRVNEFDSKRLWEQVTPSVREHQSPGGVLIFDDAIIMT